MRIKKSSSIAIGQLIVTAFVSIIGSAICFQIGLDSIGNWLSLLIIIPIGNFIFDPFKYYKKIDEEENKSESS